MDIKKIETEEEYRRILKRVGEVMDENPSQEKTDELERLSQMLEEYVDRNMDGFDDEEREDEEVTYEWEKNLKDFI